jgi:UDP-N-acetyl-D-galactosamine dehydrogenase
MGKYIAEQTIKQMIANGSAIKGAKVTVLGLTFKENCPDLRNSRVADVIAELHSYGVDVHVHDPLADAAEAHHEYGVDLQTWDALPQADALVLAVAHRDYLDRPITEFRGKLNKGGCVIDVKAALDPVALHAAGVPFWRL